VLAAKRSDLACVAVPNAMTARLDLGGAHLVVEYANEKDGQR
jgi:hypothetical protein